VYSDKKLSSRRQTRFVVGFTNPRPEVPMPKATTCVIDVLNALQLRDHVRKTGQRLAPDFRCKSCGWAVRPESKSSTGAAHFEHKRRNINCPLSDKRTVRIR
jgi:hypothetical protein